MTGSGLARGAGTMLRRLVVRVALLIGFTAGVWLLGVLFAGSASADVRLPLDVPGINLNIGGGSEQPPAATNSKTTKNTKNTNNKGTNNKSAKSGENGGLGGLVGGLVGTVTGTVSNAVSTVTTTVTKTVKGTVTTVTTTVTTTLGTVTKTVTKVVEDVAKLPEQVLTPPPANADDNKSVLPEPVTDLLGLGQNTDAGIAQRTETVPAVEAPAVAPPAVTAPVVQAPSDTTNRPRVTIEPRNAQTMALPVRAGWLSEQAAPSDNWPGPLPSPTAPVAPATPCPTFSSGGNGGSDARGMLAVLPLQTQLAPPQAGRLHDQHFCAELGRTAGLPATPPD